MSDKSEIKQKIRALEFERDGYVTFGKDDRVKDVDVELKHWRAELKKADDTDPGDQVEGVISEAEAAQQPPVDGEAIANARADAHRKQKGAGADTPVIDETEAAKEPTDAAEKRSNALADRLRSEKAPTLTEETIVTEAEVVAAEKRAADAVPDDDAEAPAERGKRTAEDSTPRVSRSKSN